jgi:hypothetical protein
MGLLEMMSQEEIEKVFKDLGLDVQKGKGKILTLEPSFLKEEGEYIWIINDSVTKPYEEK